MQTIKEKKFVEFGRNTEVKIISNNSKIIKILFLLFALLINRKFMIKEN